MIEAYCLAHTHAESNVLRELRVHTQAHFKSSIMLCDVLVARLLQFFVQLLSAQEVLDLGTFTGYSALSMAEALKGSGRLITCDKDPQALKIARRFFSQSPVGNRITVFEGEVSLYLTEISRSLDLVFIDADKMKTDEYFEAVLPHLRSGGMIIVDDVLWRAEVLNPQDKRALALHAFNQKIQHDPRITNVLLPIRHGLNIIVKL